MDYTRTKFRFCHLLSLCIALTLFQACDIDDISGLTYDDVDDYGSFFGDPNHDTVILHTQGGPTATLEDQDLIDLIAPVNTDRVIIGNIGQRQILDPITVHANAIDASTAATINQNSVEDLAFVIRHFKNQGKTVYIMGSGFGGYIVQELLATYGTNIADKYLVMGSRLEIEPEFTSAWSDGMEATYDFDGTPSGVLTTNASNLRESNLNKLFGSAGQENYLSKLDNQDLSKLTYLYSLEDEEVGPMTNSEVDFLTVQKANIIDAMGNHDTAIQGGIVNAMKVAFDL